MGISLYNHQKEAITKLRNGNILCGGVGTGKSRTGLAYYFTLCGGNLDPYKKMTNPLKLYIITTARKRDEKEWEGELVPFLIDPKDVVINSWNNIQKYVDVENGFFIFDEQRVVGSGTWVKAFYKIVKKNQWILLSGTPGDTWIDYIPVFVANGFYKNKTDFINQHVVYDYRSKYPKIDRYLNTGRLIKNRASILVEMPCQRATVQHHETIYADYDILEYKTVIRDRWNKDKEKPIENASELCYQLRKVCNSDISRVRECIRIVQEKKRAILFYNFDYEIDILREAFEKAGITFAEWNGHKHQTLPTGDEWVYFVQYSAGCEAWNCTQTDTMIFYSQNYSYKIMIQASGRIDRLNTPYTDLYYYHLKSRSGIDLAISKALSSKRKFNEMQFISQN